MSAVLQSEAEAAGSSEPFAEYARTGWALCALVPGTKRPRAKAWRSSGAIRSAQRATALKAAGLVHELSGTCAIDVDDLAGARTWLAERGTDLNALLTDAHAVRIESGKANRAKLLYRLPTNCGAMRTHKVSSVAGALLFELRCSGAQDVLPPSLHPDTGKPYAWVGDWRQLPELPDGLLALWQAQEAVSTAARQPMPAGAALERLRAHLTAVRKHARDNRDEWLRVGMAVHHETQGSPEGMALWDEWSQPSAKYNSEDLARVWESFGKRPDGPMATINTLEAMVDHGDAECAAAWASIVADDFESAPATAASKVPRFVEVDLSGIEATDQVAPRWFWHGYMPENEATLLAADGGAGKSTLALMLAACIAVGAECLGRETMRARVVYFSAEDPAAIVLRRLAQVCRMLDLDPGEVRQRLRVLDATDGDPVLFTEQRAEGLRKAAPTPALRALDAYLEEHAVEVLIVDNASDVFDADENSRPMVRAFVRALVRLVRRRAGAVLLLAHVDKSTSRAGVLAGGAAYSGSTGWNNSVRSRLFLVETTAERRELQHQKANLGPKLPPLPLAWPPGGVPAVLESSAPPRATADALVPLLRALAEFYGRGEWIAAHPQARNNAAKTLGRELGSAGRGDVLAMLRDAQRLGLATVEEYRTTGRHLATRWALTTAGHEAIELKESAGNDAIDLV